ncbi:GAF domain-containing protein [Virgibacillus doumboii]|uniref:GAF domain-containing protein n=1 Tax=Virgibacillus doumboii TaxID=2697503 RepID=UPI0013DEE3E9|nr:GAF domain-containing protein [Virgibacillus doumboii]
MIILLVVIIIKIIFGEPKSYNFWGIQIEPNRAIGKIQQQFRDLNEHSEHKTQVLKLINQSSWTISQLGKVNPKEFHEKLIAFYDFFLPGIIGLMTKEKGNIHRVAIFHKNDNNCLKILWGSGYSPEGKEKLELSLHDSKAGYCFINNKEYCNGDITQDPSYKRNPKSSREYKSLLCVPISYGGETIGVFNIDGLKSNSFDKDDIDYINYFANSISPLLYRELLIIDELNKREAFYDEKERSS